ncbi:MAG TPA: hypothetical protein VET90_08575, partial [Candidatus Binatus sp.]|nr:hypothetical protein [Candidatus Binatus sp.]
MVPGARASQVASILIVLAGTAGTALLPTTQPIPWLLLVVVGLAAGSVAGRPSAVWFGLAACLVADAGLGAATGDPGGPFWPLLWAARLVVLFTTFIAGTTVGVPPRGLARRWRLATMALVAACVVGLLGYVGYAIARSGEYLTQAGESDCRTPDAAYAWTYEAINYDPADDARLMAAHPDLTHCYVGNDARNGPDQGQRAGTEVVSSDGIRVAGWYVAAGNGGPPSGPTLVLVHGGKDNKSGMLKYAVPLHATYNLVLLDLRNQGRSTGDVSSGGVLEARDLRAM